MPMMPVHAQSRLYIPSHPTPATIAHCPLPVSPRSPVRPRHTANYSTTRPTIHHYHNNNNNNNNNHHHHHHHHHPTIYTQTGPHSPSPPSVVCARRLLLHRASPLHRGTYVGPIPALRTHVLSALGAACPPARADFVAAASPRLGCTYVVGFVAPSQALSKHCSTASPPPPTPSLPIDCVVLAALCLRTVSVACLF